jgi:hypothetical protein
MKTLKRHPFASDPEPTPCRGCTAGPGAPWHELEVPDLPTVDPPGAHLIEQTIEGVVREAVSVGMTLHEAQQQLQHALAAIGLSLSGEELAEQISTRARAYT